MNVCRLFLSPLCSVLIIIKEQTNNAKLLFLSFFSPKALCQMPAKFCSVNTQKPHFQSLNVLWGQKKQIFFFFR